jgi:hypothetical protein
VNQPLPHLTARLSPGSVSPVTHSRKFFGRGRSVASSKVTDGPEKLTGCAENQIARSAARYSSSSLPRRSNGLWTKLEILGSTAGAGRYGQMSPAQLMNGADLFGKDDWMAERSDEAANTDANLCSRPASTAAVVSDSKKFGS